MKFFKNLFSKTNPEQIIRNKLTELEVPNHAINLPEVIGEEDRWSMVYDIAENMRDQGILKGNLIGKKGWFLPNAEEKIKIEWSELEKYKVNLTDVGKKWKINDKRVYIALEDHAKELNIEDPIFHREDKDLYLVSYFRKAWYDILAANSEEQEIEFDKLIKNARVNPDCRGILKKLVSEWLSSEGGRYALGSDGMVRPKDIISELIEGLVPQLWEEGQTQVTYEELSKKYGMSTKEIGRILQKLIDENALGDVTLYATDEMIKPRMT